MQCDDSTGQILVAASLETGILHHAQQRLLVGMHANRFGEILVTVLVAYDKLAEQLTAEGFRTRKGTAWHGYSVQRILARDPQSRR